MENKTTDRRSNGDVARASKAFAAIVDSNGKCARCSTELGDKAVVLGDAKDFQVCCGLCAEADNLKRRRAAMTAVNNQ